MKRFTHLTMAVVAGTFCSQAWMGTVAPAQAATVTDTFPFKVTGKEWCRDRPNFFKTIHAKEKDGLTLTVTRDVLNVGDPTDVRAKINNTGNATIDAITMNGLGFPRNKSGRNAEFVLSGTDPGNSDHFITFRGQATLDKFGNLTKGTGTFVFQILDESNGVQNVDCIGSGTFGTGKKLAF
jgi:hypothetical protein